jgi:hypothetical protein
MIRHCVPCVPTSARISASYTGAAEDGYVSRKARPIAAADAAIDALRSGLMRVAIQAVRAEPATAPRSSASRKARGSLPSSKRALLAISFG